jgi:glycerol dehydrogenase-like iron-containing ADH family enzyme
MCSGVLRNLRDDREAAAAQKANRAMIENARELDDANASEASQEAVEALLASGSSMSR